MHVCFAFCAASSSFIEILSEQPQGHEIADPDWRNASQDIKDGLGNMLPAARTRANATYYGFIVLSIGLIVMVCVSYTPLFPPLQACLRMLIVSPQLCKQALLQSFIVTTRSRRWCAGLPHPF